MYYFCTYFDSNYLLRGLTLYRSLVKTQCDFKLFVLALDEQAFIAVSSLALTNVEVISLSEVEGWEPELCVAKNNRSKIEYYFTLSPILPLYVLDRYSFVDIIAYLDADILFYKSPAPIFDELQNGSILICEHRYSSNLQNNYIYGRYNVQLQLFRRDAVGLQCLERWRRQCLEWCHDYVDNGRYADQKYLDEWPGLYGGSLVILQNKGAGVAPWNLSAYPIGFSNGTMMVDGSAIIFFHFHGLKIFNSRFISNGLADWGLIPRRYQYWLYGGYMRMLRETRAWIVGEVGQDFPLRDKNMRGKGVRLSTLTEIVRKAWSQGMFII